MRQGYRASQLFLLLGLFAVVNSAAAQTAKDWKELSPKGGGFTVKMPGTPKEAAQNIEAGGMKLEIRTFTLELSKDLVYVVAYNQMPADATNLGAAEKKQILDGAREGMLKNINGTLLKEADITLEKNTGRDWQFDAIQGKMFGRSRAFLVGDRMYQVMVMGADKGVMTTKDTVGYLDSFKLTK